MAIWTWQQKQRQGGGGGGGVEVGTGTGIEEYDNGTSDGTVTDIFQVGNIEDETYN